MGGEDVRGQVRGQAIARGRAGTSGRRRSIAKLARLSVLACAGWCCAAPAAAAEPTPELGRCVELATPTGAYGNSVCTKVKAKNDRREWLPGAIETSFTLAGGHKVAVPESEVRTEPEDLLKCTAASGSGSFEGDTGVREVHVVLAGCESELGSCTSSGAQAGEVLFEPLEGTFAAQSLQVGLPLAPSGGSTVASFTCGEMPLTLTGSIEGLVGQNHMRASTKLGLHTRVGSLEVLPGEEPAGLNIQGMKIDSEEAIEVDKAI